MENNPTESSKETVTTTTSTTSIKDKGSKKPIVIIAIIGVLLICCIVCSLVGIFVVWPALNPTPKPTVTPTTTITTPTVKLSPTTDVGMETKNPNEFYPLSFGQYTIKSIGIDGYNALEITGDYFEPGSGSDDPVGEIKTGFTGNYSPLSTTTDTSRNIEVLIYKFVDDSEMADAELVTDRIFDGISGGFSNVTLPLQNYDYRAAYKTIPQAQASTLNSGDARIMLPEANVMVVIKAAGGYSLSEFQSLISSYLQNISSPTTEYIELANIMSHEAYQEYITNEY